MMQFVPSPKCIFTISTILSTSTVVLAQNETKCLLSIQDNGPENFVNSTGVVPLAPWPPTIDEEEWSLTVIFNDSRSRNNDLVRYTNPVTGYIQGYMTYPKSIKEATACVYMLPGFNASSTGDSPETSCRGVLSDTCINAIINATEIASRADSRCPFFPTKEELAEACPELRNTTGILSSGT